MSWRTRAESGRAAVSELPRDAAAQPLIASADTSRIVSDSIERVCMNEF